MMNVFYVIRKILLFSLAFTSYSLLASGPIKLEVLCPQSFSKLTRAKLCPKKKCRWSVIKSSKKASSWLKRDQYKVIENPLMKGIKVEVLNFKISGLALPWCFNQRAITLPKRKTLESIVSTKETLYLLEENDIHHLPRLKKINHPCRRLTQSKSNIPNFNYYYLLDTGVKACQKVK